MKEWKNPAVRLAEMGETGEWVGIGPRLAEQNITLEQDSARLEGEISKVSYDLTCVRRRAERAERTGSNAGYLEEYYRLYKTLKFRVAELKRCREEITLVAAKRDVLRDDLIEQALGDLGETT